GRVWADLVKLTPEVFDRDLSSIQFFDMSCDVKRRHGLFSRRHERLSLSCGEETVTPNRERDAQAMAATMDHSDIRGLATAFHLFLAGLPRSKHWDHRGEARIKLAEDSPHRSRASRCRFGAGF